MKFRLLDVLKCPKCGSSPLTLKNYTTEKAKVRVRPKKVLCKSFCGMKGGSVSDTSPTDCEICLGTEIVAGELICQSCGSRYGIYRGVPSFMAGEVS